jgi:hypothetical protein
MNLNFPGIAGRNVPYRPSSFCSLYQTTGPTLSTSTLTLYAWDNEYADLLEMHDNVLLNSRITIRKRGLYFTLARIRFAANTTGLREVEIYVNGTSTFANLIGINTQNANVAPGLTTVTAVCIKELFPADYLEVMGYQTSGGNLATEGGVEGYRNGLSTTRIG